MIVYLASDHGGFELKQKISKHLKTIEPKVEVIDFGALDAQTSVDYPDFANKVCQQVTKRTLEQKVGGSLLQACGILVCGSGQGMAMRANKFPHIRAALCWSLDSTQLAREHNNANVLCLGGRLLDHSTAIEMVDCFLKTSFAGGRHQARVVKIGEPV